MNTTAPKNGHLRLRGMMHDDLPDVLEIEADIFVHPWSEQDFIDHLEDYESVTVVIEDESEIVGYLVLGLDGKEMEICSCVVAPSHQRQGLGTLMIRRLTTGLAAHRWERLFVRIPERNLGALLFFRRCGFRAVAILREYLGNGQDVYVMERTSQPVAKGELPRCDQDDQLIPLWAVKHG